jgi:hypothetical protein
VRSSRRDVKPCTQVLAQLQPAHPKVVVRGQATREKLTDRCYLAAGRCYLAAGMVTAPPFSHVTAGDEVDVIARRRADTAEPGRSATCDTTAVDGPS